MISEYMQMDFGLLVLNEADVEAAISNLTSKGIKVLAQYPVLVS